MKKTPAIKSWLLRHCGYTVTVWSFIIAPRYTPTCNAFCVAATIKFLYLLVPVEIFGCWNIEVLWGFWLWRNTSGKNSKMFMLMLVCCQDINVALKSIKNQFIPCSSKAVASTVRISIWAQSYKKARYWYFHTDQRCISYMRLLKQRTYTY